MRDDLDWRADLLPGWQQADLDLGADDEGPLVATLVRRAPEAHRAATTRAPGAGGPAVLYVHGFNDYFFQTHVADALAGLGYTFYALELRRCGRALRAGQTPHWCRDLTEYAEELTLAARLIRGPFGHDRLVVMAHSTGGLVASLWAHSLRHAHVIDALVLDSPWLDLNASWFRRVVSTRILDVAPLDPRLVVADEPSAYSWHLHVDHGGRWDYDLALKPPEGFPVRAGWLRAVRRGQARVAQGLEIAVPILVCTAAESGPNTLENPLLDAQDTVLDVNQIAERAPRLGRQVTLVRIPGGVHDLALAAPRPRAIYLQTVLAWLRAVLDLADDDAVAADLADLAARAVAPPTALTRAAADVPPQDRSS